MSLPSGIVAETVIVWTLGIRVMVAVGGLTARNIWSAMAEKRMPTQKKIVAEVNKADGPCVLWIGAGAASTMASPDAIFCRGIKYTSTISSVSFWSVSPPWFVLLMLRRNCVISSSSFGSIIFLSWLI